jgi:hypothetical protein
MVKCGWIVAVCFLRGPFHVDAVACTSQQKCVHLTFRPHVVTSHLPDGIWDGLQPDGHCMYRAIEHQLGPGHETYLELRAAAAGYIRMHPEDFIPYLTEVKPFIVFAIIHHAVVLDSRPADWDLYLPMMIGRVGVE